MAEEHPLSRYSKANDELYKSIKDMQKVSSLISEVGRELTNNPYKFCVSNCNVGLPMEVTFTHCPTLDANEWPTAKKIAESIADLWSKKKAVENAWYTLSDADRKLVKKPDFLAK